MTTERVVSDLPEDTVTVIDEQQVTDVAVLPATAESPESPLLNNEAIDLSPISDFTPSAEESTDSTVSEVESTQEQIQLPTDFITPHVETLLLEVGELRSLFNQQIRANDMNRTAFERLHKEMQDYKENFLQKAMEPMFRSLIGLADHMDEMVELKEVTGDAVDFLRGELLEILSRYGIERFERECEVFDPSGQKVAKTHITGDESLHRHILRRTKPGYDIDGRIIRPEHVEILKFDATVAAQTISTQEESPIE